MYVDYGVFRTRFFFIFRSLIQGTLCINIENDLFLIWIQALCCWTKSNRSYHYSFVPLFRCLWRRQLFLFIFFVIFLFESEIWQIRSDFSHNWIIHCFRLCQILIGIVFSRLITLQNRRTISKRIDFFAWPLNEKHPILIFLKKCSRVNAILIYLHLFQNQSTSVFHGNHPNHLACELAEMVLLRLSYQVRADDLKVTFCDSDL